MHLILIDFCLYLVHLIAHLIYPPLHDQIGLRVRVIHLMQLAEVLPDR